MHVFMSINTNPKISKKYLLKFYTEVLSDINTDELSHSEVKKELKNRKIGTVFCSSGFMLFYK